MSLRLSKLQKSDAKAWKIKAKGLDGYKEGNRVLHHQWLQFVLKFIKIGLASRHYDNSLAWHFNINKTRELVNPKYYWTSLSKDIQAYVKGCNVCS